MVRKQWHGYDRCGVADAEAPLGLLFRLPNWSCEYYPPERRKETISWKTHFLGVANVVKVIWFRFRTSAARELPLSTRRGSVPIPLACTTLRFVMATSLSMNRLATGHSIRIAAVAHKLVGSILSDPANLFTAAVPNGTRQKAQTFALS